MNQLQQLSSWTKIVADTGDIEAIKKLKPQEATTNPSLILQAAQMEEYKSLILENIQKSKHQEDAILSLAVEFGCQILKEIPGRVSTEIPAHFSYDTESTIKCAHEIIEKYSKKGISKERILVKIAATWEGICAAQILEKENIHCNLTLVFGAHQAMACADAGVQLISPFVGRILDWYLKKQNLSQIEAQRDPGVLSVSHIYHMFKKYHYHTEVMGASFRNVEEIQMLAGCDALTISPKFLQELKENDTPLERKLSPQYANSIEERWQTFDKESFERAHQESLVSTELLQKGIEGFTEAHQKLGILLQGLESL